MTIAMAFHVGWEGKLRNVVGDSVQKLCQLISRMQTHEKPLDEDIWADRAQMETKSGR